MTHEEPRMSRPGRRMAPGPRRANGRHLPDATPPDAVAKWKRAKVLAEAQVINPRWGSAIGQLVWFKRLSDREAAAADRWAEWVGDHDRIKGYPRRSIASPQYQVGYGRDGGEPAQLKVNEQAFLEKYAAAHKAALTAGGIVGVGELHDIAVLNQSGGSTFRLERMQAALRALLLHWGM